MDNSLNNKISLVTGSSKGIGKATALKLANLGSDVIITYKKDKEAANNVVEEINNIGRKSYAIKCDIGESNDINELFKIIKEKFGKLDILINNAAFGALGNFMKIGKMTWNMTMNINTTGLLLCTQNAVKLMPEGSKIVNISSLGSNFCIDDYIAIGTAKSALETMTKYFACELAEKKINVNAVSGGFIETEALNYFKNIDDMKKKALEKTPQKRLGTPEDIANIIAFLCKDDSNWITGQTIIADGGFSLKF
ncbi:MAG: SDR family oxidoreductase [Candidatus Sericytochromatia bacterium]